MARRVTFIDGDGVGPEISAVTRKCMEATGVQFEWEIVQAGADVMAEKGTPLPDEVIESIRRSRLALKGPITTPVGTGFRSVNVALRQELDLYACVRPCKSYRGVRTRFPEVDLVVVRENTEDLYAGIEFQKGGKDTAELIATIARLAGKEILPDSGVSIKPISVTNSRRIVKFAFDYAVQNKRRKVSAVHKANIMKYSDGLFLEVARDVAKGYPNVQFEDVIVDNMCMQLVQKPEKYDVLVLPNLYGDIISDLCAGLVGGLGVAPGGNIGKDIAVFEATHGSAPKYKGMNKVNPTALMLSGVMLLRHIGEFAAADKLEGAIAAVIAEGRDVTYDLKPKPDDPTAVGTREMGEAIIRKMR
ncbi:MAG: isocitrate/isopropylmalate dehydrogenase family protein [Planctomycetes bacterium]|nr:isocitrate/isopropylmalate dehydrogenase family protein [Planctomycetota bacterium]